MNEWKKALYLLIIFFLFLGGCYLFYDYTFNKQFTEINESIITEQAYVDLIKEELSEQQELKKDIDGTNYYTYIPKEIGIPNIMQIFFQTAKKNNVNIKHIEIDNQVQDSNDEATLATVKTVSVNMFLNGDYVDIRSFLNDINSAERLFNLTKWQWESTGETSVNIYLNYDAYYYPNDNDLFLELPSIATYKPDYRVNPIR
ncbi:MAG: type 4a pilus biogenesis protein PilO [Vulcanibacillus sp.]